MVIEARTLHEIGELTDQIDRARPLADARKRVVLVSALDALSEDLCGRYAWDAVEIKDRIKKIVDEISPGRESK